MKHKKLYLLALIFNVGTSFAEAIRHIYFYNDTNKPITVKRQLNSDNCMKNDDASDRVYEIQAKSYDSWKLVDSNSFIGGCSTKNKRTSFLINDEKVIFWEHSLGLSHWQTEVISDEGQFSMIAKCGGSICLNISVRDSDNADTHIHIASAYNTNNWMSQLSDNRSLFSFTFPGSHDAGMGELHNCNPFGIADKYAKTQELNIYEQANAGSRYFDLRIDYDKGQLVTYHRTGELGCSGQSLVDVMNQAKQFLQENPTEVLFLTFTHTRKIEGHDPDEITKLAINLIHDNYQPYLYKANHNFDAASINLGNVRGKIFALFGNEYDSYLDPASGIFKYGASDGLYINDMYSDTVDLDFMQNDQLDNLRRYGGLNQNQLFLLSWTLTPNASDWKKGVNDLARIANKELSKAIKTIENNAYPIPNIIFLDYIDASVARRIIDINKI